MCHYNVCREYVVVASVPPGERGNDTDTTSCTGKCKLSVIKVAADTQVINYEIGVSQRFQVILALHVTVAVTLIIRSTTVVYV